MVDLRHLELGVRLFSEFMQHLTPVSICSLDILDSGYSHNIPWGVRLDQQGVQWEELALLLPDVVVPLEPGAAGFRQILVSIVFTRPPKSEVADTVRTAGSVTVV